MVNDVADVSRGKNKKYKEEVEEMYQVPIDMGPSQKYPAPAKTPKYTAPEYPAQNYGHAGYSSSQGYHPSNQKVQESNQYPQKVYQGYVPSNQQVQNSNQYPQQVHQGYVPSNQVGWQ